MAGTKILVAEHQAGFAKDLRRYLSDLGYHLISIVSRGENVIHQISETSPDLVLINIRLPGNLDGIQVADHVKSKGIPFVFTGERSDDKLFQRAGISQPFGYLLQPFNARELQLVIEAARYQHRAETNLRNLHDYQVFLNEADFILWDWNLPSAGIIVNPFGSSKLVISSEHPFLTPEDWYSRLHPDEVDVIRNLIHAHLQGSTTHFTVEHRLLGTNGSWIWLKTHGQVVSKDEQSRPKRMLCISQEITAMEKTDSSADESNRRLIMITENMTDIVGEVDMQGIIRYISPSVEKLLGYTEEQVLNKTYHQFIHPDDVHLFNRDETNLPPSLIDGPLELRVKHQDGRYIWIETNGNSPQDSQGNSSGVIFSARDITQRRESEEAHKVLNVRLTEWINDLERRNRQTELFNEMGEWLQSCRDTEEAYSIVAQYVEKIFWDVSGAMYIRLPSKDLYKAIATWGDFPPYELVFGAQDCWSLRRMRVHIADDIAGLLLCRHVVGFDHPQLKMSERSGKAIAEEYSLPGWTFRPHLCVPVIIHGEARGVLHLLVDEEQSIRHWEQLAITLTERIALALANLELQETLRSQAIRDPLTGLFNRRYMEETLSRELRRAVRFKRPLGVIMLDIDHFKHFNDDFSYAAGDQLLQALGKFLQESLRYGDVVCRYGGEEFILILPEASLEDTMKRAEHIQLGVKDLQVQHRGMALGTITISLGVAAYPEHGDHPEAVLHAVDTAIHKAKNAGRDTLVVAEC